MNDIKKEASNNNDNPSKLKLIYDDAENTLKSLSSNADAFNTRLGFLLGFNVTFIRFAMDLPAQHSCPSSLWLKLLTLILVVCSIVLSLLGIYPEGIQAFIYPKKQIDRSTNASEEGFRRGIIEARDKMIRDLEKLKGRKSEKFKQALTCLGIAAAIAAIDIAIDLFFCQ